MKMMPGVAGERKLVRGLKVTSRSMEEGAVRRILSCGGLPVRRSVRSLSAPLLNSRTLIGIGLRQKYARTH